MLTEIKSTIIVYLYIKKSCSQISETLVKIKTRQKNK